MGDLIQMKMRSWTPPTQNSNEGIYTQGKAKGCQKVRLARPHPSIAESTESIPKEHYTVMRRSTTCSNEVCHGHDAEKNRHEEEPQRMTFLRRCHVI
jgi:hypothetical protein